MTKTQSLFLRSASGAAEEEEEEKRLSVDPSQSQELTLAQESACVSPVGVRISESGNSSKFDVSSMLLISMGMAAGLSLQQKREREK